MNLKTKYKKKQLDSKITHRSCGFLKSCKFNSCFEFSCMGFNKQGVMSKPVLDSLTVVNGFFKKKASTATLHPIFVNSNSFTGDGVTSTLSLINTGVTPGHYLRVFVDSFGRVVAGDSDTIRVPLPSVLELMVGFKKEPTLFFKDEPSTGIFFPVYKGISFSVFGNEVFNVLPSGVNVGNNVQVSGGDITKLPFAFQLNKDVGIYNDTVNGLCLVAKGKSQIQFGKETTLIKVPFIIPDGALEKTSLVLSGTMLGGVYFDTVNQAICFSSFEKNLLKFSTSGVKLFGPAVIDPSSKIGNKNYSFLNSVVPNSFSCVLGTTEVVRFEIALNRFFYNSLVVKNSKSLIFKLKSDSSVGCCVWNNAKGNALWRFGKIYPDVVYNINIEGYSPGSILELKSKSYIDMSGSFIKNIAPPVDAQDAVDLAYLKENIKDISLSLVKYLIAGTFVLPALTFKNDLNTGFYSEVKSVGVSLKGVIALKFTPQTVKVYQSFGDSLFRILQLGDGVNTGLTAGLAFRDNNGIDLGALVCNFDTSFVLVTSNTVTSIILNSFSFDAVLITLNSVIFRVPIINSAKSGINLVLNKKTTSMCVNFFDQNNVSLALVGYVDTAFSNFLVKAKRIEFAGAIDFCFNKVRLNRTGSNTIVCRKDLDIFRRNISILTYVYTFKSSAYPPGDGAVLLDPVGEWVPNVGETRKVSIFNANSKAFSVYGNSLQLYVPALVTVKANVSYIGYNNGYTLEISVRSDLNGFEVNTVAGSAYNYGTSFVSTNMYSPTVLRLHIYHAYMYVHVSYSFVIRYNL